MKKFLSLLLLCALLSLSACSSIENPAEAPYDHGVLVGMNCDDAVSALKDAGFTNIELTESGTKSVNQSGKIITVSINDDSAFSQGDAWENTVPVKVSYFVLEQLEVSVDVDTGGEDGKPEFTIHTNLPDKAKLLLTLQDENFYSEQQTISVKDGLAVSEAFTDGGSALYGPCRLTFVMEPGEQLDGVKQSVGDNGDLLTGPFVEQHQETGGNYIFMECSYDSPYATEVDIPNESLSLGDVYMEIALSLSSGFGNNYSMSQDGNTITANVWGDGIAMVAMLASLGDAENLKEWNSLVSSTVSAANNLQSILRTCIHNGEKSSIMKG